MDEITEEAEPADLPIDQPARFHLGVDAKTVEALGIELPAQPDASDAPFAERRPRIASNELS
ncbi:MAG TPA: hypothetical protein VGF60_21335 [Xanthobacteraceae bacterium]